MSKPRSGAPVLSKNARDKQRHVELTAKNKVEPKAQQRSVTKGRSRQAQTLSAAQYQQLLTKVEQLEQALAIRISEMDSKMVQLNLLTLKDSKVNNKSSHILENTPCPNCKTTSTAFVWKSKNNKSRTLCLECTADAVDALEDMQTMAQWYTTKIHEGSLLI